MKFKLKYQNKIKEFTRKVKLITLTNDKDKKFICAKVNNSLKELSYEIKENATIEFLTLKDLDAIAIYRRSLCYLIAMAFYRLYPKIRLHFSYSISRSMYFEDVNNNEITTEMINNIDKEMKSLIARDIPFKRLHIDNNEAAKIYMHSKFYDKLAILTYRPENKTHFYECDGYYNYFYGRMVYSTGYIKDYKFKKSGIGMLLQYPRAEDNGKIPELEHTPIYLKALKSSEAWAKEMDCNTIASINKKLMDKNDAIDFINENEARHSRMLVELGNTIEKNIDKTKLICIAGPSSSGKTTFANRLRVELLSRGIKPIMISLDNYYLPREKLPKNERGELDYESIEALNITLFNEQMKNLLDKKGIYVPRYNFGKGPILDPTYIRMKSDKEVVIIEGIHALNEKMTSLIKRENKYKIYISPQIQVNIDHDNPLSLTDLRLLRRITRDNKFRSTNALATIKMWHNVREGEFKWIYKGIEEADYVFNSFSFYELSAYRKYTLPLLMAISRNEPLFPVAERLIRMLKFFKPLTNKWIPSNSLIREFIGGSCFE